MAQTTRHLLIATRARCFAGLRSIACQLQPEKLRERVRGRATAELERARIAKLIKSKKHVKPKSKFSEDNSKNCKLASSAVERKRERERKTQENGDEF